MRFTFLLFSSICLALAAHGQDTRLQGGSFMELIASARTSSLKEAKSIINEPSGMLSVKREMYKIPQEPGVRRMKVGKVLTGIGAGLVIGGIIVYNNSDPNYSTHNTYGTTYGDDPHEAGGQLLVGIGVGMMVPGIMVWIHGASQHRKYVEKNGQALYIPAGKMGIGYRF
jgi:hypothetical protein